ncbi:TIR domain-containing protein [Bifidobacterium sp.]|uniref:TIR domain-containing protein n=1 Tax=Bifidobacterium sp. TaxID=41200 RepID=UPI0039EA7B47
MSATGEMFQLQRIAERAASRNSDPTRHKCFISYHVGDMSEVGQFIESFGSEFIARSVGVTVEDDFVDSTDDDYIKRRIREKYLTDSTVTIVLLGSCTWTRKFVDWEISSSLRNDINNKRSGLLVYPLPYLHNSAHLPARIKDNWDTNDHVRSYAHFFNYPSSLSAVRSDIETAFNDRTARARFVDNSRALQQRNLSCS